jgi:hypothetical protein
MMIIGAMVGIGGTGGKCVMVAGIGGTGGIGWMVDSGSGGGGCCKYAVGMLVCAVGGAT